MHKSLQDRNKHESWRTNPRKQAEDRQLNIRSIMPDSCGLQSAPETTKEANILLGKYQLVRLLGYGSSAKVHLAQNLFTGQNVAIKSFTKHRIVKADLINSVKREAAILRRLRHPHIVRLHEVLASRTKIHFVLELAKGGDLFSRIATFGRLPEHLSRRYFRQLISAVAYGHSHGVFHRDLKLENLLLDDRGDLKLSDFGLSAAPDQMPADGLFHTLCGTPAYVAPEILAKKGYRAAVADIWSCGVVLFTLNAGYLPFNDTNLIAIYLKIYRGDYQCPKWTSPDLKRLIGRLLDKNPDTRITIDEILRDPWVARGIDEKEWTAIGMFQEEGKVSSKAEEVEAEDRALNAFDIIGFSSGLDLSGLIGVMAERERFVVDETPEAVLRRVEEIGRGEGLLVNRKGKKGNAGAAVREHNGNLVVGVDVYQLNGGLTVVEVDRARGGDAKGRKIWTGEFWRRKVLPTGDSRLIDCSSL
ncbi:CBL-interacting serine/threonine-protein kinase 11-like [Dendrobium catenatum]|uniref:non-specific serine/threonine protein kinase n=1 Tax=Dendrobium catenatum TaxID=906689 RepID=A0A2I0X5M8_9ASPA|nr:CBL-interacting serine/threonine-protein kinase 11-like [Dendrobium catenatum]PKU83212.1 CBL-interacting serine/threonine-protein kinase 11 [Dendrobium catenatum]